MLRIGATPSSEAVADLVLKPVVRLGFFASDSDAGRETSFATAAGESPTMVLRPFGYNMALDATRMNLLRSRGQTPLIAWMPWAVAEVTTQPDYQLADIINGAHDAYMMNFLAGVRDLGFPVAIRWAHEMNGNWYPWAEQANGNAAGQYVQAWRHVVNLARSIGATNISWVWSPNTPYPGSTPYAGLYPGDDYVDVVASQGYNWGASGPDGTRSPAVVFDAALRELRAVAPTKPVWITEVGCVDEVAYPKTTWIADFLKYVATNRIAAFVWYDDTDTGYTWRISAPAAAASAFGAAMVKLRAVTRPTGRDVRRELAGTADVNALTGRLDATPGSPSSMWSARSVETIPRIGTAQLAGVSGRLRLTYFTAPTTVTINCLSLACGDTAHAGATMSRLAVFTVDGSGNLTKVAQTGNDPALGGTAYDSATAGLTTAGGYPPEWTFLAGSRYAIGWLDVATTPAAIRGANVDFAGYAPILNRHVNAQSDIAVSYSAGTLTSFYQPLLVVGLYL